ncbi:MAG: RagB/SusD family nutrient uptake outer membrane protein [Dysgonamonadaceae bacterium]|jgi:hypothetical protein|nr:RagB/SusD family nutrient uptake outer membrane protein [Dysgonamonadaceae bacterium]
MKRFNKLFYLLGITVLLSVASCNDILDVDLPSNVIPREDVFSNQEAIEAAIDGLYAENLFNLGIYEYVIPMYLSPASDESYHNLPTTYNFEEFRKNAYSASNSYIALLWSYPYESALLSNDVIEQLSKTTVISEEEKQHYIGEAKYFRAYDYFVLTNLFGDVPWVKSSNIRETGLLPRESKEKIITDPEGIIDDLEYAKTSLTNSDNDNTRVTRSAASALLARVLLYHEDWAKAEAEATEVIENSEYELETDLDKVFLRPSKETIFRASSAAAMPSYVGRTYFAVIELNASYLRLTDDLVNSFEENDLRKEKWLKNETAGYVHAYKYKRNTATAAGDAEDLVLLRLAEQYLIRAEARAQQGNLSGAIADLDTIRNRAGLSDLSDTLSKEDVLLAVENERRHELFVEEAHRLWDLVRTGRAAAILGNKTNFPDKQWEPYKALLPIPEKELTLNSSLTQNPGYAEIK